MNYLHYDDISYAHTRQWECSLNKAEEWANQIYSLYPRANRMAVNKVISKALDKQFKSFEQVEKELLKHLSKEAL